MQRITPNLWFDDQAEEAARLYTAVFKNSRINTIARYGSAGPRPAGTVMNYWQRLSEGGEEGVCGWLKDKYGVSWQIIPTPMNEMISDPDPDKSQRAMQAMLQMKKIDIATIERAYRGG